MISDQANTARFVAICADTFNLIRHRLDPDDPDYGITSTGSTTYPYVGKNTVSGTQDNGDLNYNIANKFTPAATISVGAIFLYTSQTTGHVMCAIYTDNSGKPGNKIVASASIAVSAPGWIRCPITVTSLTGGTLIWLAWQTDNNGNATKYDTGSAGDCAHTAGGAYAYGVWAPDGISGWTNSALDYSIYAIGITGYTKGTRVQFTSAAGHVSDFYFYTHVGAAGDHFTLALYDDSAGSPNHRLWYSPSTGSANTTWNHLTVAQGTIDNSWDGNLIQNAYYWFMWQWDSGDAGPSYAVGGANTGIFKAQTYGTLDSTWSGGTLSTENWSAYLTYATTTYVSVTDAGSGATALALSASLSVPDSASGVDAHTMTTTFTIPDVGAASDTGASAFSFTVTDAGSGLDVPALNVTLTLADSGAGTDLFTTLTVGFTVTDANGTAVETLTLQNQIPISDVGAGVDVLALTASVTVTQSGSGVEVMTITAYAYPTDSGIGLETKYGGYTTYLLIYDANIATVETISTPGTLMILDIGLFAEFAWRTKPTSPMIDSLALPHVLAIIISDPASMSDKKVQGGSLPRRKMVGKEGRKVTIEGWTDEQSEIDVLEALMNGATRTFYHPSGDSFAVLVTAFNPSLRVDEFDRRIYSLTLAEK